MKYPGLHVFIIPNVLCVDSLIPFFFNGCFVDIISFFILKEVSRGPMIPWMGFMPIYLVAEAAINVYYVVMNIDTNLSNWVMEDALKIYGSKGVSTTVTSSLNTLSTEYQLYWFPIIIRSSYDRKFLGINIKCIVTLFVSAGYYFFNILVPQADY